MVGPEGITKPQLVYMRNLLRVIDWSPQHAVQRFHAIQGTIRITSLEDMSKRDAINFLDYLKELAS